MGYIHEVVLDRKADTSGMRRGWGPPRTQRVNQIKPERIQTSCSLQREVSPCAVSLDGPGDLLQLMQVRGAETQDKRRD